MPREVKIIAFGITATGFGIGPVAGALTRRLETERLHPFGDFFLIVYFEPEMV